MILNEAINDMVAADKNYIWVAWVRSDSFSHHLPYLTLSLSSLSVAGTVSSL
jgi:hypothetical protein